MGWTPKWGGVSGSTLYYTKIGYGVLSGVGDADGSGGGFHGGLGVEYKFSPTWSMTGEWLYSKGDAGPGDTSINNSNFTLGANYYF